jgi:hypothetical protein
MIWLIVNAILKSFLYFDIIQHAFDLI